MTKEDCPINSITMSLETFHMVTHGQGSPIGLGEVLAVVKQAIEEKKPIY